MNKILLLLYCLAVTACASSPSANSDKTITVLYDYEVKDEITIAGEGTKDIKLTGYQSSLSNKFTKSLNNQYKNIVFKHDAIPTDGTALLVGVIRPKLIIKEGKTFCSIWYHCRVFKNKNKVKEINKAASHGLTGVGLSEDKILALISFTHQKMVDDISREVVKAENWQ